MRLLRRLALLAPLCLAAAQAQQTSSPSPDVPASQTPNLRIQSQLILVPTTVQTKKGEIVYDLKATDFTVEADGVPQRIKLDESDEVRPVAIAVVVQCSRSAIEEWDKIRGLPTMIDTLAGGSPAQVAVTDFAGDMTLLTDFTANPDRRNRALAALAPCPDEGSAAAFDAVAFAEKLFEKSNPPGRRVILLVSETRDHGSKIKAEEVIRALGRSNVVLDAVSFSPGREEMKDELKGEYGAAGGPIGLLLMAVQALRKNAPKELARLSGGEYFNFGSQNGFDRDVQSLSNRVGNYYLISFQPHFPPEAKPHEGNLHTIVVKVPNYPDAKIHHRESYWVDPVTP